MNETWAQISDLAFEAALAGYVVALVCYAIEFASRRGGDVPADQRRRSAPVRPTARRHVDADPDRRLGAAPTATGSARWPARGASRGANGSAGRPWW